MNRFFQQFWLKGVSLLILCGWTLVNQGSTPNAIAQELSPQTLTVTGTGKQSIKTTLTEVRLGVEVEQATAQLAQEEAARRSTAVVELLRSRNVENLETTGIRLQPQYNYNNGQRRLRGYRATNLVSFRLETEDIGNLLDEAVKVGATRIDSVAFTATDSAIAAAQKDALENATLDAKAQADAVLGSLNLRSESVMSIQINNASPPVTPRVEALRTRGDMAASSAPSSPVVGGEQEIQAQVTLQIRY